MTASYYGRPVLKQPVWKPDVPWYFFVGGLAGASAAAAAASAHVGNLVLARRATLTAFAGFAAGPLLLIHDLGRPERFHHMLRVFKPTSPMSVGSWLLVACGAANGVAAAADLLDRAPVRRAARLAAGALGLPATTYTAALVADTAVPVWHEARRELPFVFAASSAASAGGILAALSPAEAAGPARRLAVGGGLAKLAAVTLMERRLGFLGEPYRRGRAGRYARLGRLATAAGVGVTAVAGRRRGAAVAGGALLAAGSALHRWAVFRAGVDSARDPRYTVRLQKARSGGS